jgi:hypothetical protein
MRLADIGRNVKIFHFYFVGNLWYDSGIMMHEQ